MSEHILPELIALLHALTQANNRRPSLYFVEKQAAVIDAMMTYTLWMFR